MSIPRRLPDQPFDAHQQEMAEWMGCSSVEELNAAHDSLHAELCQWMGSTSYSLLLAQGVDLPDNLRRLAAYEEEAVLFCQRWQQALKNEGVEHWVSF